MSNDFFSFGQVQVAHRGRILLKNISLSLNRGEFLGIVGPNGAGKSTLLMAMLGFRTIISGKAELLGRDIRRMNRSGWAALRKRIGYLPQKPEIDPFFPITVEEVVLMGRLSHSGFLQALSPEDRTVAETSLGALGVDHLRKRPFGQLSGGEQQKVQLARILTQEPEIILFDEPMSGLDLKWQQRLGEVIEGLAQKRKSGIVMITHEPQHLPPSCRKVALLHSGEILAAGRREDLLSEELLSRLYDCRVKKFSYDDHIYLSPWKPDV
ncbi:MAG: ABC transporter ATP-binding protein [Pseudomonadota bacterium]